MTAFSGAPVGQRREVLPIELFFDLVFVFAVSQLTDHLSSNLDWRGIGETMTLLTGVYGVWVYTSFVATLFDVQRRGTQAILIVVMALGLFMNAGISEAFGDQPWLLVVPMVLTIAGLSTCAAIVAGRGPLRDHFLRVLVWFTISGSLWIVGATVDPQVRIAFWIPAALIDLSGTFSGYPLPGRTIRTGGLAFDAGHMIERLRLFLILVLGESVVEIGHVISEHYDEVWSLVAAAGSFVAVFALFLLYFGDVEPAVRSRAQESDNPMSEVHVGIVVIFAVLVALVAFATGVGTVVADPLASSAGLGGVLLLVGPAIYLCAQAAYVAESGGQGWKQRVIGAGVLFAASAVADQLTPLIDLLAVLAVLIAVIGTLPSLFTGRPGSSEERTRTDQPSADEHPWVEFAVIAGVVVLAVCAVLIARLVNTVTTTDGVPRTDSDMLAWVLDHRTDVATSIFRAVTHLADPLVVIFVATLVTVWLALSARWRLALLVVGSTVLTSITTTIVKASMDRARPPKSLWLGTASGPAFPSGHAAQSVALYGALGVVAIVVLRPFAAKVAVALLAASIAFMVGASRIYLAVHWRTDVLCGWAIALAWLSVLLLVGDVLPRYLSLRAVRTG